MNTLSDRIRSARKALGMSQKELAATLGVDRVAVTKWESGKSLPNPARLELIANTLEIRIEWLVAGETRDGVTLDENNLLPKEQKILKLFRQLSSEDKERTLQSTQDLLDLASIRVKGK